MRPAADHRPPTSGRPPSENELFLLLARARLSAEEEKRARSLLGQDLDWTYLLDQGRREGIFPLLCRNLGRVGFFRVPPEAQAVLEEDYRRNGLRNALLVRELGQVLQLLGKEGIPAIPLKGVALAHSLYGDIASRHCSDLDLLIPLRDVPKATRILLARGYRGHNMDRLLEGRSLGYHNEWSFGREEDSIRYSIDLHWAILWTHDVDRPALKDLWAEARPTTFFDGPCLALSPSWELLYLASHASHHGWEGLKWLADIHELCVRREVDWAEVEEKARRLGWDDLLHRTLGHCVSALGTPVPPSILRSGRPLRRRISFFLPGIDHGLAEGLAHFNLPKGLSARLRYLLIRILEPTTADWQAFALPKVLHPLYYPLRVLRIGWRLLRRLIPKGNRRTFARDLEPLRPPPRPIVR